MRRVLGILIVALALAPGLLWRDPPPVAHEGPQPIVLHALPIAGVRLAPGIILAGAWELDSADEAFGGYSSLVLLPGGDLQLFSDRGRFLRVTPPGDAPFRAALGTVSGANSSDKRQFDIEAATRDPASGTMWLAYENSNAIRRYRDDLSEFDEVGPPEMRGWPSNSGPEALVRLADGRFIVLSEAVAGWTRPTAEGLLFANDPIAAAPPQRFQFVPPSGFRATDIVQLPDGRAVILLRKIALGLPPRFVSRLVVADPATIVPGAEWAWTPLAEIAAPLPAENYEGVAVEPQGPGAVRLWLVSDDNSAALQRTLLLALDWQLRSSSEAIALQERAQAAKR